MKIAHIVGKGASARHMKHLDYPDDIFVAINHAAIFMDDIDYLFANDIEGLEGIPNDKFYHVKNLAVPFHPHLNGIPHENITYERVIEKYKKYNCNFIIYNLETWKTPSEKFANPEACKTSAGKAIGYLLKYESVKKFMLYGIAKEEGYHPDILTVLPQTQHKFGKNWKKSRIEDLKDSIYKAAKKYEALIEIL